MNWSPPTAAASTIETVCLGVVKKVSSAFVAFDFRLRSIAESGPVKIGRPLTWSAVFPLKAGMEIPAEGFLHLDQKQRFKPNLFLEKKAIAFHNVAVSADESSGRITLNDQSQVKLGSLFSLWSQYVEWSAEPALERLAAHRPGPLDLDTELQEEVILRDYEVGPSEEGDEPGQSIYPVTAGRLHLHAVAGAGAEGKALKKGLDELRKVKKDRPPLFGLMHYERCRLVFQPLSSFGKDGPDYLTISKESINKAALLKAMNFK